MNPMWAKYVQDSTHVGLPGRPWRRSRLDVRPACPLRRWLAVDPKTNLDSLAARLVYVHVQHGWCPTPEVSACCVFPAGHTVLLLDRVLLPMLTRRSNLTAVLMNHVITLSPSMVHSQLLVPVLFQPAHHHSHTNRDVMSLLPLATNLPPRTCFLPHAFDRKTGDSSPPSPSTHWQACRDP